MELHHRIGLALMLGIILDSRFRDGKLDIFEKIIGMIAGALLII